MSVDTPPDLQSFVCPIVAGDTELIAGTAVGRAVLWVIDGKNRIPNGLWIAHIGS